MKLIALSCILSLLAGCATTIADPPAASTEPAPVDVSISQKRTALPPDPGNCAGPSGKGDAIMIMGISVGMSTSAAVKTLEGRGYTCEDSLFLTRECRDNNTPDTASSPTPEIWVSDINGCVDSARFYCSALNLCEYSPREQAQFLINNLPTVRSLDLEEVRHYGITYCGRGIAGDRVCLEAWNDKDVARTATHVELQYGTFGDPSPTLD